MSSGDLTIVELNELLDRLASSDNRWIHHILSSTSANFPYFTFGL